jgi:hypothetical protein
MTKRSFGVVAFRVFCAVVLCVLLRTSANAESQPQPTQEQIYPALTGMWTGNLEYRDFQSDQRVTLPTWLEVKTSADGKSLQFAYTYDDGPGKTVVENSTITIEPAAHRFTITSDRDHSSDVHQIGEINSPRANRFLITLTGTGTENGKPVEVRITVKIDRNLYQFIKETKPAGQEFKFRDGYTFTRRAPSAR